MRVARHSKGAGGPPARERGAVGRSLGEQVGGAGAGAELGMGWAGRNPGGGGAELGRAGGGALASRVHQPQRVNGQGVGGVATSPAGPFGGQRRQTGFSTRRPDSSLCPRPCWVWGGAVILLSPCPSACSSDARGDVQPDSGVVPRVSGPAQARVCAAGSFPLPGRGVCGQPGWTLGVRPGSLGC